MGQCPSPQASRGSVAVSVGRAYAVSECLISLLPHTHAAPSGGFGPKHLLLQEDSPSRVFCRPVNSPSQGSEGGAGIKGTSRGPRSSFWHWHLVPHKHLVPATLKPSAGLCRYPYTHRTQTDQTCRYTLIHKKINVTPSQEAIHSCCLLGRKRLVFSCGVSRSMSATLQGRPRAQE